MGKACQQGDRNASQGAIIVEIGLHSSFEKGGEPK